MRCENFAFSDMIYINVDGESLDLHNDYDFTGFSYDVQNRSLQMIWVRGDRNWVRKTLPGLVRLQISGVHYLRVEPRSPELPYSEDDCLDSIGYDTDEDWVDGQFWTVGPPDPNWRWSFAFESGAEIVVGAEAAMLAVK